MDAGIFAGDEFLREHECHSIPLARLGSRSPEDQIQIVSVLFHGWRAAGGSGIRKKGAESSGTEIEMVYKSN